MPRGYYHLIIEQLKRHGCFFRRHGAGDHELWFSPITNRTFPVDRGCQSKHTANAVMKQAGINYKF